MLLFNGFIHATSGNARKSDEDGIIISGSELMTIRPITGVFTSQEIAQAAANTACLATFPTTEGWHDHKAVITPTPGEQVLEAANYLKNQ